MFRVTEIRVIGRLRTLQPPPSTGPHPHGRGPRREVQVETHSNSVWSVETGTGRACGWMDMERELCLWSVVDGSLKETNKRSVHNP